MAPLKLTIPSQNTQGIILIIIQIALSAIAFVVYLLRVFSHKVQRRWQVWSDILCGLGLIGCFVLCFIMWASWSDDIGLDLSHFTYADAINSARIFLPEVLIWNFACVCVRISVVLLYLALFTNHPIFDQACYFFIGLNVASFVAIVFAASFICRPVLYVFDKTIPNGHCGNVTTLEHAMAFWNLIADFMLVLLPQWIIWTLQMHSKKKLGLSIIFAMGSMICLLTIIRLVLSYHYETKEFTKQAGVIGFITAIEPTLGVIAASLPYMPAVVLRIRERLLPHCPSLLLPLAGCGCGTRRKRRAPSRRRHHHDAWHGYGAGADDEKNAGPVLSLGGSRMGGRASRASRASRSNNFSRLHDMDVRSGNFDSSFRNEYKAFRVGPPSETSEDVTPDEHDEVKDLTQDGISVRQTVTVVRSETRRCATSRERERQMLTSMDREGDGRWSGRGGKGGAGAKEMVRSVDRDSMMSSPSPIEGGERRGRSSTTADGRGPPTTLTSPDRVSYRAESTMTRTTDMTTTTAATSPRRGRVWVESSSSSSSSSDNASDADRGRRERTQIPGDSSNDLSSTSTSTSTSSSTSPV